MAKKRGSTPRRGTQMAPSQGRATNPPAARPTPIPKNAGTMAWENGEQPRETVKMPKTLRLLDVRTRPQQIARTTETHIIHDTRDKPAFCIWGHQSNVNEAKVLLEVWFGDSDPSYTGQGQTGFGKLPSYTYDGKKEHDKLQAMNDQKLALRRPPLPDTIFEAIANFVWPVDEYAPWEALGGKQFPVLDDIRLDHNCTIVYDRATNVFNVMGGTADVLEAVTRVRGTLFQLKAREIPESKTYLLHWRSLSNPPARITLLPYAGSTSTWTKPKSTMTKAEQASKLGRRPACARLDSSCMAEVVPQATASEQRLVAMAKAMKYQALKTLNKLRYYRGNLSLKIRLGTLRIDTWDAKSDGSLKSFEAMVKMPQFEALVTEHIGDESLEDRVLDRLNLAEGFSRTVSSTQQMDNIKPIYTASLTIDMEKHYGLVVLTKSWQEYDNGDFLETSTKWAGLDQTDGEATPSTLLDISMTDLKQGLSWNFEVTATRTVDPNELPEWLQGLEGSHYFVVIPKEARNLAGNRQWCQFESYNGGPRPVARKRALQQRVTWQFDIPNSAYSVEVVKNQDVTYRKGDVPGREISVAYEPRWAVNVVHRDWEVRLAEHTFLDAGKPAAWLADLPTWFPVDDDKPSSDNNGHIELVRKLMKIQEIVCGESDSM